ncbi:glycosyltransferase family 2 protein [Agrobacterium radiobacter]|uniref:glycosyltransferase family 2 protein n=1 Tax=Agrobacterium radiobacter TaxID=362 RepID=UPI003CF6488B
MVEQADMRSVPQISVVVPCFGCTGTLAPLHERLTQALEKLVERHEIVFVDDRGEQDQWPVLSEIAARDNRVRVLRMSRNFGQQIAITAGLAECRGEYAVVMDCDLQDPPEFIPNLWEAAQKGFDIVYASRYMGDPAGRRLANRLYFLLMNKVVGYKVDPGQGSFSLISRQVINAYLRFQEHERHYLFILRWLGFDSVSLTYERHARQIGSSSYTLRTLLAHSIQGFFFQSTAPLVWILWLGLMGAGFSTALGVFFIVNAIFGNPPEGFTALMLANLMIGSIILTCVGGVGLYVSRVFDAVKRRPLYVIDRSSGPPTE